jgi:glutathione S-transferase
MKLYDTQRSGNAWKVRLLAGFLGKHLERITLSIDKGHLKAPEFRRVALFGQVPVLETDTGQHLCESVAILYYLAQGTGWWPDDQLEQARVLTWLSFEQDRHMRPLAKLRLHFGLKTLPAASSADIEQWTSEARDALEVINSHLASRPQAWIATDKLPSIADIALYPYTRMASMGRIDLSLFPNIERWLSRIERLPGYQHLFPGTPGSNLMATEIAESPQ